MANHYRRHFVHGNKFIKSLSFADSFNGDFGLKAWIIFISLICQSFISVTYLCMNNKMQPFLTAF